MRSNRLKRRLKKKGEKGRGDQWGSVAKHIVGYIIRMWRNRKIEFVQPVGFFYECLESTE